MSSINIATENVHHEMNCVVVIHRRSGCAREKPLKNNTSLLVVSEESNHKSKCLKTAECNVASSTTYQQLALLIKN